MPWQEASLQLLKNYALDATGAQAMHCLLSSSESAGMQRAITNMLYDVTNLQYYTSIAFG